MTTVDCAVLECYAVLIGS